MRYVFREDAIQLPAGIVEAVGSARLPEAYQDARKALAACNSIDECAEWADKAAAIASYARQADDPDLENYARRIRLRATRRLGEILLTFDGRGGNRSKDQTPPVFAPLPRAQAAQNAGVSRHKADTAVSIARIDDDDFAAIVESPDPPGTTSLAQSGRVNRSSDRVNPITHSSIATDDEPGTAARVIENVLQLGLNDRCNPAKVVELMLKPGNPHKLTRVHRGLALAMRIKNALDMASIKSAPALKVVPREPPNGAEPA